MRGGDDRSTGEGCVLGIAKLAETNGKKVGIRLVR